MSKPKKSSALAASLRVAKVISVHCSVQVVHGGEIVRKRIVLDAAGRVLTVHGAGPDRVIRAFGASTPKLSRSEWTQLNGLMIRIGAALDNDPEHAKIKRRQRQSRLARAFVRMTDVIAKDALGYSISLRSLQRLIGRNYRHHLACEVMEA